VVACRPSGANLKRFAYIDALRGYAVLGVILVHTGQYCGFVDGPAFGARGVQLFFVVSAFTLLHSWRERSECAAAFFVRRVFRIVPMFWLSIPVYLAINGSQGLDAARIIAAAVFLQGASPHWITAPIVAGGWSVDVEVAFYCLFPLLAQRIKSLTSASVFLVVAYLIFDWWMHPALRSANEFYAPLPSSDVATFFILSLPHQLPAFAVGFVAFYAIPKVENWHRTALEVALICEIIAVGYLAMNDVHNVLKFSLCFGAILTAMGAGAGAYLVSPVVTLIGRCSFSIYLLHFVVLTYTALLVRSIENQSLRFAAMFLLTTAMTTTVSMLTFKFIEQPTISLGNRIIRNFSFRISQKHRMAIEV
jgi:peptidoglycan/LPS O-acetylase OafA/YrhL